MSADELVVLVTNTPEEHAEPLARALLERRLVACVNIVPGVRSLYRWAGEVCDGAESTLLIKTTAARAPAARHALLELHPFDVPELLTLTPTDVPLAYREWATEQVSDASTAG